MDLKSLRCFVAVTEHLNFSRAAQVLYMSQPALSLRIRDLETELGVSLFERTHQAVFLTEVGSAILPAAQEILEKIDLLPTLAAQAKQATPALPKKLRIGIDPTEERTDLSYLTDSFFFFRKQYSDVEMEVIPLPYEQYEESLLHGDIDLCVVVLQGKDVVNPQFLTIPLLREPVVLVAADTDGKPLEELIRTRDILLLGKTDRWNERYLGFLSQFRRNLKPNYVSNTTALCMNLLYGNTISFLPQSYALSLDSAHVSMFHVDFPNSEVLLTLAWNKQNLNPAVQLMVNAFQCNMAPETI